MQIIIVTICNDKLIINRKEELERWV